MNRSLPRPSGPTILLGWLLAGAACRPTPAPAPAADPNEVVATWAHGEIRRAEIADDLARRLAREPVPPSPQRRQEVLQGLLERHVRVELLRRKAEEQGVPERPAIKSVLRTLEDHLLAEDWTTSSVGSVSAPAERVEEEVKRLMGPGDEETRRFSHIFLRVPADNPAAWAEARKKAAQILADLSEGRSFEELARVHSDSITARSGGLVQWTSRAPLHDKVASVVFSLAEGQVSGPVETESGVHLFRVDGIRRPTPRDPAAVRQEAVARLDAEARTAAIAALRDRAFDESGIKLEAGGLAASAAPDAVLATIDGAPLLRSDLEHASKLTFVEGLALRDRARLLAIDRLLAARRRAAPIGPELQARLARQRRGVLVAAVRDELVAAVPVAVEPGAARAYYDENKDKEGVPFLREPVLDLLFFGQEGDSAGAVYAAGEQVSKRLRGGEAFDKILASLAGQKRVVVRTRQSGVDLEALRAQSNRVSLAVGRLAPGEVSAPIYMDGEKLSFGSNRVVDGKGLLFVRLAAVGPRPFEACRARIEELLRERSRSAGVHEIQVRLNQEGGLKVLVPGG